jgi:membrane protein DedA with SNARE-associated domain
MSGAMLEPLLTDSSVSPRVRTAVLGFLAVLTTASIVGAALSPYLLVKSPLLLVAVSAAAHHVALAAASVEPLPLIVVATLRRTLTSLSAFGLGYVYGPATLGWLAERYPRLASAVGWISRMLTRFGLVVLLVAPVPTVSLLAGSTRRKLPLVIAALLVGHAVWNTITYFLGEALAHWTDALTAFLRQHLLTSTLVCVGLIVLQQGVSWLVKRRRAVAQRDEPNTSSS